ncbi:MAG: glycosyltransferase [Chloroflexota bacterium]|nr:glycosyltransferase [Chloroflexota bacterium]MDE2911178.1 glycosyltransferase [Chloroflexota bacterium]
MMGFHLKIALVHDWLNQIGGAEDVLEALKRLYPASPVYTSIYDKAQLPAHFQDWDIRRLWIDRLPAIHKRHQAYLPLYPLAWNRLDLQDYEVILSNKSGFCHGLRRPPKSLHICYCLTPTRYVWQLDNYLDGEEISAAAARLLRPFVALLRRWDYAAAQRVSHFIAISAAVKERISRFYGRTSVVIFPPVDTARFHSSAAEEIEDYYLVVSRLVPYKRIDLAIQAATELGLRLKIAGSGRDGGRLRALADDNVEFLGYVPDRDLPRLMAKCKALIFPGLEDFGIAPVQAQAAGRPVIAFGDGGALDTVIPGVTGEHFAELTVDSLKEVWRNFDERAYNPQEIRLQAKKFDVSAFVARISAFVEQAWAAHSSGQAFQYHDPIVVE